MLLKSLYLQDARQTHKLAITGTTDEEALNNQERVTDAHFAWLCITEDVLIEAGCSDQGRRAKLRAMHNFLMNYDFTDIMAVCKGGYDLLLEIISGKTKLSGEISPYSEFKALLADFESSLVNAVMAPIKGILTQVLDHLTPSRDNGIYRSSVCIELKLCTQYLTFLRKLELNNPSLWDKAVKDYQETEELNSYYDVPDDDADLKFIQLIIAAWFDSFRVNWANAKHGPGSVADTENISRSAKNWALLGSRTLDQLFNGSEVYTGDKSETEEVNPIMGVFKELLSIKGLRKVSKLTCVPKDATKLRTISMEPATLQYLQQAVKCSLYEYIKTHEVGCHIHIDDQTFNRALAYDGSLQNNFATLDLSHASDSVTKKLVLQAFKKVPYLRKILMLTRSTHTDVTEGSTLKLLKFAPMGSALCFPVECILFAAIAARSVQLGIERGLLNHNERSRNHFSVYGDDTIVPVEVADICVNLLEKFGFTVNKLKSYLTGPFKESCGGNYYCGYDITGIKYNPCLPTPKKARKQDGTVQVSERLDASAYRSMIAYANAALQANYRVFRCFCIWKIKSDNKKPYFTDNTVDGAGVHSCTPTNYHLTIGYNSDFQYCYYNYTGIKPKLLTNSDDDFYRYYQYFIGEHENPNPRVINTNRKNCAWEIYTLPEPPVCEPHSVVGKTQDDRNTRCCVARVATHEVLSTQSGDESSVDIIGL